MRTVHYSCLLAFLVLLFAGLSYGQNPHEFRIPPPTQAGQYLNDAITGDTLANGARVDPQRIYVLTRGGQYLVNALIRNTGWTLSIKAHDSTGAKPVIFLYPNPSTTLPPGQMIDIRGNVNLKNLIITGYFEPIAADLGGLQGSLMNTGTPGNDIVIDSCILTNTNGNHIRTDLAPRLVKITNCIFANMGYLGRSNLGAGKGIDVRGGSVDSLIMVNNTFVNWQDRIIRHYGATAPIKYLLFDHNTLVNGMSYHGLLSLGKVGPRIIITNNLFVDPFALGNDTDGTRQVEFGDSGEKDQYGGNRMVWVITSPNDTTVYTVKHNYYSISTAGQNFLTTNNLTEGSPLTWYTNRRLGADSVNAFTKFSVTLPNIPNLMIAMMTWYRDPAGANKTKGTGTWNASFDYDRRVYQYWRDTLNCAYPTASAAYTAATGGYPVGDLNWFPARRHAWETDPLAGVAEPIEGTPSTFALYQNYPNPFNPATRISFNLEKAGYATVVVYNMLGQKVASPVSGNYSAGVHEVTFDASQLSTGVYFYRLESGSFVAVRKMMVLR